MQQPPYQTSFSEEEILAIVQVCCVMNDAQTHPAIALTQQLRALRRLAFPAPKQERLRILLALLDRQTSHALGWELYDAGALTIEGLNLSAIESICLMPG